ncbi:hypothetical protein WDW37_02380 [Bdellovibrionota bacterium FG-1]
MRLPNHPTRKPAQPIKAPEAAHPFASKGEVFMPQGLLRRRRARGILRRGEGRPRRMDATRAAEAWMAVPDTLAENS